MGQTVIVEERQRGEPFDDPTPVCEVEDVGAAGLAAVDARVALVRLVLALALVVEQDAVDASGQLLRKH